MDVYILFTLFLTISKSTVKNKLRIYFFFVKNWCHFSSKNLNRRMQSLHVGNGKKMKFLIKYESLLL